MENFCIVFFLRLVKTCFVCVFTAALDRIRAVSSNALSIAGRVQNFIGALTGAVRHVGERRCSLT